MKASRILSAKNKINPISKLKYGFLYDQIAKPKKLKVSTQIIIRDAIISCGIELKLAIAISNEINKNKQIPPEINKPNLPLLINLFVSIKNKTNFKNTNFNNNPIK